MSVVIVTGSGGLVGSEAAAHFAEMGMDVVGMDNDMRREFFGAAASTAWQQSLLTEKYASHYRLEAIDIRDKAAVNRTFEKYGSAISRVIHAAAQPSHDWAARDPQTDFGVNALGTLNLLEACRKFAPQAAFVFMSTNKVYGDTPNRLPLHEQEARYAIDRDHLFAEGISEEMSIDSSLHSLFGASKLSADILVQEYGRYFGMATTCLRAGCLTGPNHSGAQLHGFLAYLMKCTATGTPYTVFGYKAKQVRDNLHSADLIDAIDSYCRDPRPGEVYNVGGGLDSNCSMLEAIALCQEITGRELNWTYDDDARQGDHIWWISDMTKFRDHYPQWRQNYNGRAILTEIFEQNRERWSADAVS